MKRDFSDSAYNELVQIVNQVESEKWSNFTDWIGDGWYSFEEWIGLLNINRYLDNVNDYHKKVIDKNNASKETIDQIFSNVKSMDQTYATRFIAYKTMLEQFKGLVNSFSDVITPQNGTFHPDDLSALITQYDNTQKYLSILGTDGLTEEDLNQMDEVTMATILEGTASSWLGLLPNVKVGEKVEIPIGPGATLYCNVSSTIKGDSDYTINTTVEEQQVKLKNISYSSSTDGLLSFGVNGDTDGKVSVSAESGGVSFSINSENKIEGSSEIKVGNDTYKVQLTASLEEVVFEESIKTDLDTGSVTTVVGIKQSNNTGWKSLPSVEYEPDTSSVPQLEVNWEIIGETAVTAAVIVGLYEAIKWGVALATAVPTGGLSLAGAAVLP